MKKMILGVAILCLLTACGHGRAERGLSGAAIGATVGYLGSDVVGGSPGAGALLGGLAGAAIGVATGDRKYGGHGHRFGHRKARRKHRRHHRKQRRHHRRHRDYDKGYYNY